MAPKLRHGNPARPAPGAASIAVNHRHRTIIPKADVQATERSGTAAQHLRRLRGGMGVGLDTGQAGQLAPVIGFHHGCPQTGEFADTIAEQSHAANRKVALTGGRAAGHNAR